MQAINPFLILDVDEAATRDEIDAAHRRLVRECHPDLHAGKSEEEQRAAACRMAEINHAHELLADPKAAAAHKAKFDRVRAAGVHIAPAPQRPRDDSPHPQWNTRRDLRAAAREWDGRPREPGTPWTAHQPRRWFRRG